MMCLHDQFAGAASAAGATAEATAEARTEASSSIGERSSSDITTSVAGAMAPWLHLEGMMRGGFDATAIAIAAEGAAAGGAERLAKSFLETLETLKSGSFCRSERGHVKLREREPLRSAGSSVCAALLAAGRGSLLGWEPAMARSSSSRH
jgi:hypothetical protein